MPDTRIIIIASLIIAIPFLGNLIFASPEDDSSFHTASELVVLLNGDSTLFITSNQCQQCHGFDTAMVASVTGEGEDVNVFDDWKTTMMANSAKDPFWRAKVSHEVLVNPVHQAEIESKCTSCHAPQGHYNALHQGAVHYGIADMLADTLGVDGVACLACHQLSDDPRLGDNHSGTLYFDTAKVAYGPFVSPLSSPMLNATQYEPKYSEHISDAGICAGCHTLITQTFDLDGNPTGNTFVEQATYHEWLNSLYNTNDISCQNCHMPSIEGQFFLAAGFETPPRSPFYLHELVGANTTMMQLLKEYKEVLDIEASDAAFDETIAATFNMLQNQTLDLELNFLERSPDTLSLELWIRNKAGHKFPSGYPARRAFVSLVVQSESGDTLFHSGKLDENFEVFGQDQPFEPHHQTIRSEEQVQIYQMVMADVAGNFTTVLDRADQHLKDNRLVPEGFTTTHPVYDTTRLVGAVLNDPDFNREGNTEGSGTDQLYFKIPMQENLEALSVTAAIYYQSTPPKWMAEMFAETSPEIEAFRTMFQQSDRSPVLIREKELDVEAIMVATEEPNQNNDLVRIERTASNAFLIHADIEHQIVIFDINGRVILQRSGLIGSNPLSIPDVTGMFFIQIRANSGIIQTSKFLSFQN